MTRPVPEATAFQEPLDRLQAEPAPWLLRFSPWLGAALLAGLVLLAALLRVDTVVVATGRIATSEAPLLLRPLAPSRLISLHVQPGAVVAAGSLLARLDPTVAAADLAALTAERDALAARIARLEAELGGGTLAAGDAGLAAEALVLRERRTETAGQRAALLAEIAATEAAISAERAEAPGLGDQLAVVREVEDMRTTLAARQAGSQLAVYEARLMRLRAEADQRRHLAQMDALHDRRLRATTQLQVFDAAIRREATEALAQARPRLAVLDEAIAKARAQFDMATIVAPRPGVVLRVAEGGPGSMVGAGEPVVVLVPTDVPLLAEIGLRSGDTGRVVAGDRVTLKIDAYPWRRHGVIAGRLSGIGHASFTPEGGTVSLHPARVALDAGAGLTELPPGSALLPGMTLTAEIQAGTRSVLVFFLDPVLRGLSEALREP